MVLVESHAMSLVEIAAGRRQSNILEINVAFLFSFLGRAYAKHVVCVI